MAASKVWAFYYLQGQEGESYQNPNAFELSLPTNDASSVRFSDFMKSFPPMNFGCGVYHFRFRIADSQSGYVWSDISDPAAVLPLHDNIIFAKVLRLDKLPTAAAVKRSRLRRKPLMSQGEKGLSSQPHRHPPQTQRQQQQMENNAAPAPPVPPKAHTSSLRPPGPPAERHVEQRSATPTTQRIDLASKQGYKTSNVVGKTMSSPGSDRGSKAPVVQHPLGSSRVNKSDTDLLSHNEDPDLLGFSEPTLPFNQSPASVMKSPAPAAVPRRNPESGTRPPTGSTHQRPPVYNNNPQPSNKDSFEFDPWGTKIPVQRSASSNVVTGDDPVTPDQSKHKIVGVKIGEKNYQGKSAAAVQGMIEREKDLDQKIAAALDEKRKGDEREAEKMRVFEEARQAHGQRLKDWAEDAGGQKKNVRTLLSTLHTILWDDSPWKPISIADLLQPGKVRKAYINSMRIVSEDRIVNLPLDQQAIAKSICESLHEAYAVFQEKG